MPNHVRVQLQLDTGGSGAVLEAEGEQEQVQAVLEAARAEGSEGDASMLRQQQAVEQQLQEVEESGARQQQQQQQGAATQQQEVKQQQQQQEPSKQQAGAGAPQRWAVLSKPPVGQAKSAAQRSAEFAHFVSQCYYTADPFACLSRQADVVGAGPVVWRPVASGRPTRLRGCCSHAAPRTRSTSPLLLLSLRL